MKYLLILMLLIPSLVFGANSATEGDPLPLYVGKGRVGSVVPIVVNYDTVDADLTIKDPAADEYVAIVGINYIEADAHNLIIKSGSSAITTYQFSANSGLAYSVGKRIILTTDDAGEDLIINSDVAITPFTMYIVVYKQLWLE